MTLPYPAPADLEVGDANFSKAAAALSLSPFLAPEHFPFQ